MKPASVEPALRFQRDRFWARVQKGEGCWRWDGSKNRYGYGFVSYGPRGAQTRVQAHRVAWTLAYGPIPDGAFVLHHCDNPPCVRPDHLFLGTQGDNMVDMAAKRRGSNQWKGATHCPRGHAYAEKAPTAWRRRCMVCHGEVRVRWTERQRVKKMRQVGL